MKINSPLSREEVRHIIFQLGREDRVVQVTLQKLERELRQGRFISDATDLQARVIGCLSRNDLKVKRWALNVLCELGAKGQFEILETVVPHVHDDPDLLASTVRFLFSELSGTRALKEMSKRGLEPEGLALIAASEFDRSLKGRLVKEKIPLDNASSEELRAAIVLTGKGQAPENLFFERYPNSEALSELNLHQDASVSKYSLWGIAELGLGYDLVKLQISEFDSCEEQVRKWLLRVMFSDVDALCQNADMIAHGAKDESAAVREEAALGLRNCFHLDLSARVIKWFLKETDSDVRGALIDHIARFAHVEDSYERIILEIYADSSCPSDVKDRIEVGVAGTDVYSRVKSLEIRQKAFMLLANDNDYERLLMPKNEINISAENVSGFSGSGNVSGNVITQHSGVTAAELEALLQRFEAYLAVLDKDEFKTQGAEIAKAAKVKPSASVFKKIVDFLKLSNSALEEGSDLVGTGTDLIEDFSSLLDGGPGIM